MKQGKVFFHPIEGSGQLSITWSTQLKGDAIEANHGDGVGFFSAQGELLSVLFDDVQAFEDHQILEFTDYTVEVSVQNGAVSHISLLGQGVRLGRREGLLEIWIRDFEAPGDCLLHRCAKSAL